MENKYKVGFLHPLPEDKCKSLYHALEALPTSAWKPDTRTYVNAGKPRANKMYCMTFGLTNSRVPYVRITCDTCPTRNSSPLRRLSGINSDSFFFSYLR